MLLKEAHDIGESLQKKIEDLPDVERVCFNRISFLIYNQRNDFLGIRSY
jgi:hypothetical protein